MVIKKSLKFDRSEICGSKSPVSIMLEEIKKLGSGEELEILLNDEDWLLVVKNLIIIHDLPVEVIEESKENSFTKVLIRAK
jgi:TusA-related sulfurtransferase